jgi:hypothetical protein
MGHILIIFDWPSAMQLDLSGYKQNAEETINDPELLTEV